MRLEPQTHDSYPLTEVLLEAATPKRVEGIVVGTLRGFNSDGLPCVDFPGNGLEELSARSTVSLTPADRGQEVALMFESGDASKPIVLGLIHHPVPAPTVAISKDEERLVLKADKEIVLQCGEASITLTKAGKVLIRGAYLLSRSSGVNRIKGGSVQIN